MKLLHQLHGDIQILLDVVYTGKLHINAAIIIILISDLPEDFNSVVTSEQCVRSDS